MVCALTDGAHVLYFCTVNHGNIPFFSKDFFVFGYMWPENTVFRIYYTVKSGECQFPSSQNPPRKYPGVKRGGPVVLPQIDFRLRQRQNTVGLFEAQDLADGLIQPLLGKSSAV